MALTLGQKIRELRLQKGLTQSALSGGLVTPSMISQIESDKANPSYKVMDAIAARLDTPIDYFFADVETQLQAATRHKLAKAHMGSKDYKTAVDLLIGIQDTLSRNVNYLEVRLDLGECYYQLQRYEEAIEEVQSVLTRAEKEENTSQVVQALHLMGLIEVATKKHHRAIYHMRKAFDLFDRIRAFPLLQAAVAIDLGIAYYSVGDSEEAFRIFQYAYELVKDLKDKNLLAQTYMMLSNTCLLKNELELANEYATVAQSIFEVQSQVKMSIDVQKNLTMLQATTTVDFCNAVPALTQVVKEYKSLNYSMDAGTAMGNIGECFLRQEQYEKCVEWCDLALTELANHQLEAAPTLFSKGKALSKLGQFSDALECLQTALDLFQEESVTQEIANVYTALAELYEAQGEFANSIHCLQKVKESYEESLRDRGIIL